MAELTLMLILAPFLFLGNLVVGFTMSTDARAKWGGVRPGWALYEKYKRSWESEVEESSKRARTKWWLPPTHNVPYHHWGTGELVWDTKSSWWYLLPITCPEFPDVLDEDIFQLLYVFGLQERQVKRLLGPDNDLYRWAIISASERAVSDLGR